MSEVGPVLNPEPARAPLGDMAVTAQIKGMGPAWEVVVAFSRANDLAPVSADDVETRLLSSDGGALDLLEAPTGLLPEFGGGLGTSVNARYRFDRRDALPEQLIVRYGSTEVAFRLGSARR